MTKSSALVLRLALAAPLMGIALVAGGCSGDGGPGLFSTGSITEPAQPAVAAAKPAVDPTCVSLSAQIDKLRQGGAIDRLEKVADGRTPDVTVKRSSIATQAQLNKANAEFIAKCGPALPKAPVTAATPAAPGAAATTAKTAVKTAQAGAAKAPAAPAGTGVTVAPPQPQAIAPQVTAPQ